MELCYTPTHPHTIFSQLTADKLIGEEMKSTLGDQVETGVSGDWGVMELYTH
jgi:hypothetical protein